MEDIIHALRGPLADREIGDTPLDPLEATLEVRQVGEAAGGEIVDHAHPESFTQQCLDQMRADEAGPAGNQCELGCRHGGSLLSMRSSASAHPSA